MKAFGEHFCGSSEHIWRPNRREFLFVGLVGSVGLSLGNLFKLQAQSAAKAGQILVTRAVYDRARSVLPASTAGEYQLKGFDEPIGLYTA